MLSAFFTSMAVLAVAQARPATLRAAAADTASLVRATPIRLHLIDARQDHERLNAQAPASVACRAESKVPIGVELPKTPPPTRRFTLHEPKTVSFWEAIDRVCCATSSWPWAEMQPGPAGREPSWRVVLAPAAADRGFVCNDGAFRVALTGLFYVRTVKYATASWPQPDRPQAGGNGPSDLSLFSADLLVMVEPTMRIEHLGGTTIRHAVDDLGRSLIRAHSTGRESASVPQGVIHQGGMSMWVPLSLGYPHNPGKLIRRLGGSISVRLSLRAAGSRAADTDVNFQFSDVPMP